MEAVSTREEARETEEGRMQVMVRLRSPTDCVSRDRSRLDRQYRSSRDGKTTHRSRSDSLRCSLSSYTRTSGSNCDGDVLIVLAVGERDGCLPISSFDQYGPVNDGFETYLRDPIVIYTSVDDLSARIGNCSDVHSEYYTLRKGQSDSQTSSIPSVFWQVLSANEFAR